MCKCVCGIGYHRSSGAVCDLAWELADRRDKNKQLDSLLATYI